MDGVTAVVVTYGERAGLAIRSARCAVAAGADRVIVVANGSSQAQVRELTETDLVETLPLTILALTRNAGSSGGFSAGICAALKDEASFVWLLDDDAEASPDALQELMKAYGHLVRRVDPRTIGLVSYRPDRRYQRLIVAGASPRDAYPAVSSFLSFDVARRLTGHGGMKRLTKRNDMYVRIPYGPYGGFFAHRGAVEHIGVPDQSFVLYEDDAEYTHRLTRSGGGLFLVPGSVVRDTTPNWLGERGAGRAPVQLLDAPSAFRVYYAVRNRVYFETRHWRGHHSRYAVNRGFYVGLLKVLGQRLDREARLRLILSAIDDGEQGRMGARPELALP